jgi:hypothetical protein
LAWESTQDNISLVKRPSPQVCSAKKGEKAGLGVYHTVKPWRIVAGGSENRGIVWCRQFSLWVGFCVSSGMRTLRDAGNQRFGLGLGVFGASFDACGAQKQRWPKRIAAETDPDARDGGVVIYSLHAR